MWEQGQRYYSAFYGMSALAYIVKEVSDNFQQSLSLAVYAHETYLDCMIKRPVTATLASLMTVFHELSYSLGRRDDLQY